jgi:hypothetical protein
MTYIEINIKDEMVDDLGDICIAWGRSHSSLGDGFYIKN